MCTSINLLDVECNICPCRNDCAHLGARLCDIPEIEYDILVRNAKKRNTHLANFWAEETEFIELLAFLAAGPNL